MDAKSWCCSPFEGAFENAGERGLAVVVGARDADEPASFYLQGRAVDQNVTPDFHTPFPLALVSEVGITFCPWCGVRLEKYYRRRLEQMRKSHLLVPLQ